MKKHLTWLTAVGAASALVLSGCAAEPGSGGGDAAAEGTVTVRLWDDNAKQVYEESVAAFQESHPDIKVNIETVPWADYFSNLRQDVAAGNAPDMFWLNGANMHDYVAANQLAPVADVLGTDDTASFDPGVVDQYSFDGKLMGIPQISDGGIALYYNAELLEAAGLTPADLEGLKWSPGGEDTLLPVLQKLTVDANGHNATEAEFDPDNIVQYGFNASQDLQAIILPFIAANGGSYQDGDTFTYTNPKTQEAFQYIVDLINTNRVAPPAQDTNPNGDYARDAFLQGKIAIFQSGTYNLANVSQGADFDWGIAGLPGGPAGVGTPSPGVVMVTNAAKADNPAVQAFAKWIASADGNKQFGESGSFIPAVVDARQSFIDFWDAEDAKANVTTFFVTEDQTVIPPAGGANWAQAEQAFRPILDEMFLGRVAVPQALKNAEDAANAAIGG